MSVTVRGREHCVVHPRYLALFPPRVPPPEHPDANPLCECHAIYRSKALGFGVD